jgi:NAD-dependent SIR2 family protein deacetylase
MDEKTLEELKKKVQEWTNQVPLVILGSGASIPFGIPSMRELGENLKSNITFSDNEDKQQFDTFKSKFDKNQDLETTLLTMQLRDTVLNKIVCKTWNLINQKDIEFYEKLLQDNSIIPLSDLIAYLLRTAQQKLTIITTNYDRLAEYAASIANAFICNGFAQNYYGNFSTNIHKNDFSKTNGFAGQVNLWKVHGSLDWFSKNNIDYHFPMCKTIPQNYTPSIVTPGSTKYSMTHFEPYRTIFAEADSEIMNARSILCIGYGFNDVHVQPKLITQIKNGKPIIVITKELTAKTKEAIINNNCKNYVLFEQANDNDTRVYSSVFGNEQIISDASYWKLEEYLKLIK